MSSAESSRKLRHFGLLSQQKRIRHIKSVSLKNLSTDRALLEDDAPEHVHFVLLRVGDESGFYTSEQVQDIVNPTWGNLDLGKACDAKYNSLVCFIIQIWGSNQNGSWMLIEWKVHLRGLIHIGEEPMKESKKFQPDSIVFGQMDSFYTAGDCLPVAAVGSNPKFCLALEVEQNMVSLTYDVFTIARLHSMQRAIKQSEVSFSKAHTSIMETLTLQKGKTTLKSEIEELSFRINLLQEDLTKQQLALQEDRVVCIEHRGKFLQQKSGGEKKLDQLRGSQQRLQDNLDNLSSLRENYGEVKADYFSRRSTLIRELAAIYPIDVGSKGEHYINRVMLPNAENYAGCDDAQIAIALGHTCQLVLMIARFLQMPLRYPMVHLGSRSIIRDHITAHLTQKERDFPLYSKGREKMHFNYAVYLLNRNIVQVRQAVRLSTQDLRATLPNLKNLLEQKWGVRRPSPPSLPNSPEPVRAASKTPGVGPNRPLPPPPQYTETQVDPSLPSFPRSPPPPYEANFAGQRVRDPLSGELLPTSRGTVVVEASVSPAGNNAANGDTGFDDLSGVGGRNQRNGTDVGDQNDIQVERRVPSEEMEESASAIESNSLNSEVDNGTNGFHSNSSNDASIGGSSASRLPRTHRRSTSDPANHRITESDRRDNGLTESHSEQNTSDHSKNDKLHKVLHRPLKNSHSNELNIQGPSGSDGFVQDISSRTDALSNRGRFNSFNKVQSNAMS